MMPELVAVGLVVMALHVLAFMRRATMRSYGDRLGRVCVVTIGAHSYLATCVAVSHRGAVAVRGMTNLTRRTVWISWDSVDKCVRWFV